MGKEKSLGYPPEIFSGTLSAKFNCEECKRVLRVPVQGICGHRFCRVCVEKICENAPGGQKLCPACVNSEDEFPESLSASTISPDHAVRRELQKLQVRCINLNCDWTGTLKSYESHEASCPHRLVICKCGEAVIADRLKHHQTNSCPASKSSSPMNSLVRMTPIEEIKRQIDHLETRFELGRLGSREGALDHIRILEERVAALESAYKSYGVSGNSPGLSASYVTLTDLEQYKQIIKVISQKVSKFEALSAVLNNQIKKVVQETRELDSQYGEFQQRQRQSEAKVKNFERILALHDIRLGEMEDRIKNIEQFTSYDGTFLWKITDWKNRVEDAKERRTTSLYSPPFYTSRYGYKMCLRLYPRGDGMGKDSHVSLFFVVMRGPYDALLSWPFLQKVTLTLLDQTLSNGDAFDSFTPDPNSSSFQRPTSEMNVASGCPRFYEVERLDSNADRFLVNDTMFVKCVVDTSGKWEIQKR